MLFYPVKPSNGVVLTGELLILHQSEELPSPKALKLYLCLASLIFQLGGRTGKYIHIFQLFLAFQYWVCNSSSKKGTCQQQLASGHCSVFETLYGVCIPMILPSLLLAVSLCVCLWKLCCFLINWWTFRPALFLLSQGLWWNFSKNLALTSQTLSTSSRGLYPCRNEFAKTNECSYWLEQPLPATIEQLGEG